MREKLIELMCEAKRDDPETGSWTEWLAAYLLQNGVVVLPCKVGEMGVSMGYLQDWYQNSIDNTVPPIWTDEHLKELCNDFIIIPKEEAEKALERSKAECSLTRKQKLREEKRL